MNVFVVIHDTEYDTMLKRIFHTKDDAIQYINNKGFTVKNDGGWIRPYAIQRGYSKYDEYVIEEWHVD